ncbi:MAG: alpha/beta fold hydrolase [Planctomycetota bacterium]
MKEERFDLTYNDEPGRVIRGRVTWPSANSVTGTWALLLHGFKGHMDWGFFPLLARGLAECGVTVVRFNTSGSGVGADMEYYSDPVGFERDTYSRQLEDIARVREAITSGQLGELDAERGVLIGHSRGGGMGLIHASEHAYQGVVTWASICDPIFFGEKTIALWREQGYIDVPNTRTGQLMRIGFDAVRDVDENAQRLDILAAAGRIEAPVLVLHGSGDDSVPVACAHQIAERLPNGEVHVLEGAGHTFGAAHPLTSVEPDLAQVLAMTAEFTLQCLGLEM